LRRPTLVFSYPRTDGRPTAMPHSLSKHRRIVNTDVHCGGDDDDGCSRTVLVSHEEDAGDPRRRDGSFCIPATRETKRSDREKGSS